MFLVSRPGSGRNVSGESIVDLPQACPDVGFQLRLGDAFVLNVDLVEEMALFGEYFPGVINERRLAPSEIGNGEAGDR